MNNYKKQSKEMLSKLANLGDLNSILFHIKEDIDRECWLETLNTMMEKAYKEGDYSLSSTIAQKMYSACQEEGLYTTDVVTKRDIPTTSKKKGADKEVIVPKKEDMDAIDAIISGDLNFKVKNKGN